MAVSAAVGITSVNAARASAGRSRATSLLPLHHIALVPVSKSADIELTLTLGVHGPGTVHAIVYDDQDPTPVSRDSIRT